jgi:zinc transporter, ZIP family
VATATARRVPLWASALAPVAIIAALLALFLVTNPLEGLRAAPPVEALAFERTTLSDGLITLHVRNDGPDPVAIAQVQVNDSYRDFSTSDRTLRRLETADVTIPYPWDPGLPLHIGIVTSTGLVIEHDIDAAALTPRPSASTLGIYALLGLYIGVIPVAAGLLWFGALRRAAPRWIQFFVAFTVGLLAFLLLDTFAEGLELAQEAPATLDGLGLFAIGALASTAALVWLDGALRRRSESDRSSDAPLWLAYLVAAGIGLHNLGEGLAVGAALATGEIALGTFLVVGFALHNTTEGLAIVAPLGAADERPSLWHFGALGLAAGGPAIVGAWAGGFVFSAAWAALAFGVAAGAIAQVIWQIGTGMSRGRGLWSGAGALGLVTGFVFMYATGLWTG